MPRNYDKIQLPTSITSLETIARMAKVVKDNQPLTSVTSKPLFMAAKANGIRGRRTTQDTHTESTLACYGLIEYDASGQFFLSALGKDLVQLYSTFPNDSSMPKTTKLLTGLRMLWCWKSTDGGRDIHPGRILIRLLIDSDIDFWLSDHEITQFLLDPVAQTDADYDAIKKNILAFRAKNDAATCLPDVNTCKTYLFLPAFSTQGSPKQKYARWGLLDKAASYDLILKGGQFLRAAESSEEDVDEDADGEDEATSSTPVVPSTTTSVLPTEKYKKLAVYKMTGLATTIVKTNIMYAKYLSAIRTKPFILLAGISGTGKTRLVRQLARGCCHEPKLVSKETNTSGNYECIPVRPNWHDSTELLGYVTRITKNDEPPKYVVTPFVEFLAKAWTYRETPFFLCLDEMNLAPVEQYFAEYLSVVESRDGITVGAGADAFECLSSREKLVRFDALEKETKEGLLKELFDDKDWAKDAQHGRVQQVKAMFEKDGGIRLPPNLVVMGTVNMDETTCTFSRKVLDRAMSFELNEVEMKDGLDKPTETTFGAIPVSAATPSFLKPYEFYDDNKVLCDKVIDFLDAVNKALDATPFKIAYRSRDEIMLYCVERTQGTGSLAAALDEATSMKILSRIEGDNQHVKEEWLADFKTKIGDELAKLPGFDKEKNTVCSEKLDDMIAQARFGYTSFWLR